MASIVQDGIAMEVLDELKTRWSLNSIVPRRELSGRSGASIYLVDASGAYDGHAILKIFDPAQASEIAAHQAAIDEGGVFADKRFPKIAFSYQRDDWSAALMTVAGDGLKYIEPLSTVSEPERIKAMGQLTDGLLIEWNELAQAGSDQSAQDTLKVWLGSKANNSRSGDIFEQMTGLDPVTTQGFKIGNREFPNPLDVTQSSESPLANIEFSPIMGHQHGDLHGGNVLVHAPRGEGVVDNFIIDFDHYKNRSPILFDIAYFELAQLLAMRQTCSQARWLDLTAVTARMLARASAIEAANHPDDIGMIRFAGQLRDLVFGWQAKKFPYRREDIERQFRLACVAAGLNFSSKESLCDSPATSTKLKEFALLYAAQHTRELYEFERISLPSRL